MLNMDNFNLTKEWEKEMRSFDVGKLVATVAYVAVNLSNGGIPRQFDFILNMLRVDLLRHPRIEIVSSTYLISSTLNGITKYIFDSLMTNKSFREWNLTSLEAANFVDVDDDKARAEAGLFEKSEKDFIDLDAFRQNVYCGLRKDLIEDYFFETHD